MRLSKLYCSHPTVFETITFNRGLNIVLAEVRRPDNPKRILHDLGKSLLARLIDFCLLKKKTTDNFPWRREDLFGDYMFFLEIQLESGQYCTMRRAVDAKVRTAFKIHTEGDQNFVNLDENSWDKKWGFERAKEYLNGLLDLVVPKSFSFRHAVSYFLRNPASYSDVFLLSKFKRGKDLQWKPMIAEILGFDAEAIFRKYEIDSALTRMGSRSKEMEWDEYEIGKKTEQLEAMLQLKVEALENKESKYDAFDFADADIGKPKELVSEIDLQLSKLVQENYYLRSRIERSTKSIVEYNFDLKKLESFYQEIGVYFEQQLVKDYRALVEFTTELVDERNEILKGIISECNDQYEKNMAKIKRLNLRRSELMKYVKATGSFSKFKILQGEISILRSEIEVLKKQIQNRGVSIELDEGVASAESDRLDCIAKMETEFDRRNEQFKSVNRHFRHIIQEIVGDVGNISIDFNKEKNVVYKTTIRDIETKQVSSKDKGTTYMKLMCAAFDLAVLATYSRCNFFHFVYHDGIFDGLDRRAKRNMYNTIVDYVRKFDIQYIFTCIEDELPDQLTDPSVRQNLKDERIIIKTLHDDGADGRLFKMDSF